MSCWHYERKSASNVTAGWPCLRVITPPVPIETNSAPWADGTFRIAPAPAGRQAGCCVMCGGKGDWDERSDCRPMCGGTVTLLAEYAPALPCPEPGNCAADGKCGEDGATEPSEPLTTVEELRRDHPELMQLAEEHLAETEQMAAEITSLRASLAEREKEIETLEKETTETVVDLDAAIAERDAIQQRLDDSRSLQEGTAALLGDAIAERDAERAEKERLERILEEWYDAKANLAKGGMGSGTISVENHARTESELYKTVRRLKIARRGEGKP